MAHRSPALCGQENHQKEHHDHCNLADEFMHDASRSYPVGSPMKTEITASPHTQPSPVTVTSTSPLGQQSPANLMMPSPKSPTGLIGLSSAKLTGQRSASLLMTPSPQSQASLIGERSGSLMTLCPQSPANIIIGHSSASLVTPSALSQSTANLIGQRSVNLLTSSSQPPADLIGQRSANLMTPSPQSPADMIGQRSANLMTPSPQSPADMIGQRSANLMTPSPHSHADMIGQRSANLMTPSPQSPADMIGQQSANLMTPSPQSPADMIGQRSANLVTPSPQSLACLIGQPSVSLMTQSSHVARSPANLTEMTQVPMHPSWPQYQVPPPDVTHSFTGHAGRRASRMGGPKGPKFVWSREQKEILEQYYSANHFANQEVFKFFTEKYDIPVKKVKCWFQNRRSKDRKQERAAQQAGMDPLKFLTANESAMHRAKCAMKLPVQYPCVPPNLHPRIPHMNHLQACRYQKAGHFPIMPYHAKYPTLMSQINAGNSTRHVFVPPTAMSPSFHNIRSTAVRFGLSSEVEKPPTVPSPLSYSQSIVKQATSPPPVTTVTAAATTASSEVSTSCAMTDMPQMQANSMPPPYQPSSVPSYSYANTYNFYNQNTYNLYNFRPGLCNVAPYTGTFPGNVGLYQDTGAVNLSLKSPVSCTMPDAPKQYQVLSAETTSVVNSNSQKIQTYPKLVPSNHPSHLLVPVSLPVSDGIANSCSTSKNQMVQSNMPQAHFQQSAGEKEGLSQATGLENRKLTPLDLVQDFRNRSSSSIAHTRVDVRKKPEEAICIDQSAKSSATSSSKSLEESAEETAATPSKLEESLSGKPEKSVGTECEQPSQDGSIDETDLNDTKSCSEPDLLYAPLEVKHHNPGLDSVTSVDKESPSETSSQNSWTNQPLLRDAAWSMSFTNLPDGEGATNENGWPPYPTSFYDENNNTDCENQLEAARKIQIMLHMQYLQMIQDPMMRSFVANEGSPEKRGVSRLGDLTDH